MSEAAVRVEGLSHSFGKVTALSNIGFEVLAGTILGVFGSDGAGKTTLLRAVSGLSKPDKGSVHLSGVDVLKHPALARESCGYLAEGSHVYEDLTVQENAEFFREMYDGSAEERSADISELLTFVQLADKTDQMGGDLSGGQRQRLALANVLVRKAPVLLLDEPTTGLDPVARRDLWRNFAELKADGHALVVATPYLDEVGLCDEVLILGDGEMLAYGRPENLIAGFNERVWEVKAPSGQRTGLRRLIQELPEILHAYLVGAFIRCVTMSEDVDLGASAAKILSSYPEAECSRVPARFEDALIGMTAGSL